MAGTRIVEEDMGRVDTKIALVTGAGSGLGRAISILLAAEGAKIAVTDINQETAAATAAEINAATPDAARAFQHDVTDEAAWQGVLKQAVSQFGGLHVLVNNAGIGDAGTIEETDFASWKRVHSVDLDSVFLGCKYAIPLIAAAGGGSIVNISSVAGIIAGHNMAAYNSAKAGVRLLSKSVALHCARKGYNIRSNSVHPTFINTPILKPIIDRFGEEEALAKLRRQIPIGRVGVPNDVAYGVLYLASDESSFVTGSELIIDGGISAM
jgi:NAD(P)-dependent dehydrogenase (short-subunit alcohol dehydrogenase family)